MGYHVCNRKAGEKMIFFLYSFVKQFVEKILNATKWRTLNYSILSEEDSQEDSKECTGTVTLSTNNLSSWITEENLQIFK